MALAVTYMMTCDSCLSVIDTGVKHGKDDIAVPARSEVIGMDLCDACLEKVRYAVKDALGLSHAGRVRTVN